MSVVVRIPTPLRRMTNGQDKVEVESGDLGAMVEELEGAFPGFKERLLGRGWGAAVFREHLSEWGGCAVFGGAGNGDAGGG